MTVSTTKTAEYAVGNGITTSFPFDFVTLDASHIYVYVNGSEVTTGFTVSVNPDQANNPGGSVDFDVAVSSGDEVAIIRVVPLDQLVDYTTYDRFPAEVHESALDKLTMLIQQAQNSVDGTFGFSQVVSDTGETKISLSAANRAGKLLSFDSNGDLMATQEVGSWRGDWAPSVVYYERDIWRDSAGDLYYVHTQHTSVSEADSTAKSTLFLDVSVVANTVAFDSVADMQAATFLRVGDRVRTLGYYTPGDGGGNDYKIVAAGTGTDDGGGYIDLTGISGQAKGLFVNSVVNVKQFGAKGDGVADDTAAVQAALSSGAGRVYFPKGEYLTSNGLELPSNLEVFGDGYTSKITSTGTNKRVLFATSKNFIAVRNLFINGNLTGNGSISAGADGGDGVFFHTCENVVVEGCFFDNIGQATYTGFSSGVCLFHTNKALIRANTFLSNSKSRTGADISFAYYCSTVIVTENISYSEQDSFISGSSVGLTDSDTAYHTITGNIGFRADGSDARTGILLPYNAKTAFASIVNNVLVNFPANGIYLSAAATPGGVGTSAGIAVTGNVVRYCGGDSSMTNISAGIYLSGRGGATCSGNLIVKSGYKSDGTARDNAVPGIRLTNTSRNISVVGNTVSESRGYGIEFANTAGGVVMETISVCDNVLFDNVAGGVIVVVIGATTSFKDVLIVNNNIKQETNDAHGITIEQWSGAVLAGPLNINGNHIIGVTSSVNYGITTNVAGMTNWAIKNNNIKNFNRGINFGSAAVADKEVGYNCIVSGNILDTCTTGVVMAIGTGKYAFLYNTTYINCSANISDANRVLNAVRLNGNVVQVQITTTPPDGAWLVGQQVINSTPASGAPIGWTCSVAGSPGTWLAMANYA